MSKSSILTSFTLILFGIIFVRLVQLQIVEHDKYSFLAKNNSTRYSITRAPRGIIYDRNYKVLATNKQSLSLVIYPALLREEEQQKSVSNILSQIIEIPEEKLFRKISKMDPTAPLAIGIRNDLSMDEAIQIYERYNELPGISIEKQARRYYPYGELGAHFLGYVGQVNKRELDKNKPNLGLGKNKKLIAGDVIGKEGLEKVFDQNLRGINGEERVPVDRLGRILNSKNVPQKTSKKAMKGDDLYLTIDIELQRVAEKAMGNMAGAAVIINPRNGEILALVSKPGFDPNIFTKPIPVKVFKKLNRVKAFLNRATSAYTPGSIWKPITAIAALEKKAANAYEQLPVTGSISFGGFSFGDWTAKEDIMDITGALAWSRDTFFYQIAKRMKPEWIEEYGKKLGAGKKTGVELLGEVDGIVPSPEWKKRRLKQEWFPGNTLHFSIGQSFLMVTPLQAAKWISAIAMNGKVPQLHLVRDEKKEKAERNVKISENTLKIVKKGLKDCVEGGTGVASKLKDVKVAGKTGSAEVHGYKRSTHGWFVAYAPAGNDEEGKEEVPEIALAILGEGAGHGGSVCAPVAKKIFEKYFEKYQQTKLENEGTEKQAKDLALL